MDPVAIGKKVKELFPQYSKVDDALLGQKYMQKYGAAVSGIQSGQLKMTDIPEAQRTGVSVGLQGVGYKPEEQLSAADAKKRDASANADRILQQLEDLYYGGKGAEGDLAKGRLGGIASNLGATLGINAPLKTYKDLLVSIRPTLAKAAGDAGNLALQEQIMAGKVIPTAYSTPEEAAMKFKSVRARFGLQERDLSQVQGPPLNQAELTLPNLMKLIKTTQNYPQTLQQTGQEIQQNGPLAAPSSELQKLVGGNALQRTTMSQGAASEVATPLLMLSSLLSGGKGLINKLNPTRQITEGVAAREAGASAASQTGKLIDGNAVSSQVEKELGGEALNKVPQAARTKVKALLDTFKEDFKGKIDPNVALQRLEGSSAGGTFTKAGSISAKASAQFEAAVNRVLKEQFKTIAPEVLKGQAQIATGKTLQSIFDPKNIARTTIGAGATAGAFGLGYGLLKLLGIGGNQGNSYGAGQ